MKTAPARLQLTLLGGFQAQLAPGDALVLPTRKTQALVAYLALPLGQAHAREQLAALLWGDMPDAQARGNLRHALSRIRKTLPRAVQRGALFDGPSVSLDPALVDVDVAHFERLVADRRPAALEQILALYRGDLLAGLALREPAFEDWLTAERERLRELAIQGLTHLLTHQQQAGAVEPAIHTGLRLLTLDPLQEPLHRAVMRLYASLGRREAALRQYQHCLDALRRELGAAPDAETRQLHEQILHSRPAHADRGPASEAGPATAIAAPAPDLLVAAAAALPEAPPPTNVPAATSELIGRAGALAEVTALVGAHRLVTLIGPGGIGKTRLALEVARELLPAHADGAWVVELAPLSDPGLVPVTVAGALGLSLPTGAELPERVASALGGKRLLLVLDNCEHLIEAAARMAAALLRADPHVRVLATSREPLRTPGEYVYRVPSLEVPPEGIREHQDLLDTPAVRLFVTRAQAMDQRFFLDARRAVVVGAICRRLDGIPLAIELAAARTAALGVEGLAARLDDRFRLLTGGHRTALRRHQTLRATL
ncbi:MAG TPA: BTAD domain-containing putative transcriptional regulator, partial [Methylomirabilota bacterium]